MGHVYLPKNLHIAIHKVGNGSEDIDLQVLPDLQQSWMAPNKSCNLLGVNKHDKAAHTRPVFSRSPTVDV